MALPSKQHAFIEDCYELYEQKMFRVALAILHDEKLAEDAVQDAFLQLIRHKVFFRKVDSDDCKRYILATIKNASINIYNKRKSENRSLPTRRPCDFTGNFMLRSPQAPGSGRSL